jgi:hypothetical protein
MRFFASHSIDQARRPVPPGDPRSAELEGSIAALPMASLKHIARAAQIAAGDVGIQRRIDLLIMQNDSRGLGQYLETLGAEGRLGDGWAPHDFVSARGIKRTKSRAGRRTARKRAETSTDILRRRTIVIAKRITRRLLSADDLSLLARYDATSTLPRRNDHPAERSYEALENLDEMIAALPHVKPVDPRTWRKLTELESIRAAAKAFFIDT